jgi:hypothetical protein
VGGKSTRIIVLGSQVVKGELARALWASVDAHESMA